MIPLRDLKPVIDQIENWCFPARFSIQGLPDDTYDLLRDHGVKMLGDLLTLPQCNRPLRTYASWVNRWAELGLIVEVDPVFEVLFGNRDHKADWEQAQRERTAAMDKLALVYAAKGPAEVLADLHAMEQDAAEFGKLHGGMERWWLYKAIANHCHNPGEWLAKLIDLEMPANFLGPFLDRVATSAPAEHERLLGELLDQPLYESLAIDRILYAADPPEPLLTSALSKMKPPERNGAFRFVGGKIPVSTVARLLGASQQERSNGRSVR